MAVPGKKAPTQFSSPTASVGSDEDLHIYCQPCDLDGSRLPAYGFCTDCKEHLCETCFKVHKRHTLSRHHILLDKHSMPQTFQSSHTTAKPGEPDHLTQPCLKHKKETLKFYCNQHKELLCSVCVTLDHTACKVNYIPDISAEFVSSPEQKATLKTIDTIIDQYKMISEEAKKLTIKSNNSLNAITADIKTFRQEVNQRLDEMEKQLEQMAKVAEEGNTKKLQTVNTAYNDARKSLTTTSDTIQQLNTPTQADRLFIEVKSAQQMIADYERNIGQLALYDVKDYQFVPNAEISALLKDEISLGDVKEVSLSTNCLNQLKSTSTTLKSRQVSEQEEIKPTSITVKSRQVSKQGEIRVKTSTDEYECNFSKMILLTPDCLIITDWDNTALLMVDIGSHSVIDRLQVESNPINLTLVSNTDLAVTFPISNEIQLISTLSGKLRNKKTLKVDGQCYGISCFQEKLVVSFVNPAKLQTLDKNGTVLSTVSGRNVFGHSVNVICNSSSIYISDCEKKTVTRLNWQGDVIGSYCDMSHPLGLTLSSDGTIFVCDKDRNVIKEISGDCSIATVILQNLQCPKSVCWCPETKTMFVNSVNKVGTSNKVIQVFKLV